MSASASENAGVSGSVCAGVRVNVSVSVCVGVQRECEGALESERMHVLRAGLGARAWAWARERERGLRPAPAAAHSERYSRT